jgi:hypothetical protein
MLLPFTETVVAPHAFFFGLRKDTRGTERNEEAAAAAMPLFPVRRRTAAAGLAGAAGPPLLQPQPGDHEARAW